MKAQETKEEFENFLKMSDLDINTLTPDAGIHAMINFYKSCRVDDCPLEADGDMLLFQWGIYDWGQGEWFDLNITRQLIPGANAEDEDIWQLSLTFKYKPDVMLKDIGDGNQWCEDLDSVETFGNYIKNNDAFHLVSNKQPEKIELVYVCAG